MMALFCADIGPYRCVIWTHCTRFLQSGSACRVVFHVCPDRPMYQNVGHYNLKFAQHKQLPLCPSHHFFSAIKSPPSPPPIFIILLFSSQISSLVYVFHSQHSQLDCLPPRHAPTSSSYRSIDGLASYVLRARNL